MSLSKLVSRCRKRLQQARSTSNLLRRAALGLGFASVITSLWVGTGCTRQKYRCKTDTEAYYLLDEKRQQSCEEDAETIRIEIDPRSRMFDPFNPDRPPMPEDDPQNNRFLQCVDHKRGYPLWEANGRTNAAENPEWWQYLPLDERGVLVLDLNDAVRIALLHSPDYQANLEDMYLSALNVSIERFRLDSQFFAGSGTSFSRTGSIAAGSPFGRTNLGIGSSTASVQKLYATGGTLVANLANSLTWQIAGPDSYVAPSLISFTFLQPLLALGGRDVVLENLTFAERTLLSNVRAFERYRRGFYTQIATGIAPDVNPGVNAASLSTPSFSQRADGYIGILQTQLNIANTEENIVRQQDIYLQYQDTYREQLLTMPESQTDIPTQQLQVAQARQNIYQQQASLLQQQAAYQQTLDSFKATLGLPPYVCIEIKGDLLDRFKLISAELRERRTEMSSFRGAVGIENSRLLQFSQTERDPETGESFRKIAASPAVVEGLLTLRQQLEPINKILDIVQNSDLDAVRNDIKVLEKSIPTRRKQLDRLKTIAEEEREMVCGLLPLGEFDTSFLDGAGLEELPKELTEELDVLAEKLQKQTKDFNTILQKIQTTSESLDDFATDRERFRYLSDELILGSQDLIAAINESFLAVQLIQARARTESVTLPDIDLEVRDAVEIARRNRRDWLIRKTNLVDAWRQIEVIADTLESSLNFSLTGNAGNIGTNPFAFHSSNGSLAAGVSWDAPITRLIERNAYRAELITYQRARRAYYLYEDAIWESMRSALRFVRQTQLSFEIQRFAVQNAALQITINEDIRQIRETLGQGGGVSTARDTLQGLQDFLRTQTDLIRLFATYESARRVLDRDLGTMQIDDEGLWIDPGPLTLETVGGGIGQAIAEFGLGPGEELVPGELQLGEPVEVIPLEQMPQVPSDSGARKSPVSSPAISPALGIDTAIAPASGKRTAGRDMNIRSASGYLIEDGLITGTSPTRKSNDSKTFE